MTSQTGQQVTLLILLSISRSKDNQAMVFGQLIKYNMRNFFLNHTENEVRRLVPYLFSFFRETNYNTKASGQHLSFYILW